MSQPSDHGKRLGLGWIADPKDERDLYMGHPDLGEWLQAVIPRAAAARLSVLGAPLRLLPLNSHLPTAMDLRPWASPVWHQSLLNSCSAFAVMAMIEYYQRRARGSAVSGSKLFLYKTTRNLLQTDGNAGTHIRSTMAALALFGVVPEKYWPYKLDNLDEEPTAFHYALARHYRALKYYRLDPVSLTKQQVLASIRQHLASGFMCAFGMTLTERAYSQAGKTGKLPFPTPDDPILGGHAMAAAGYDDQMEITHPGPGGKTTRGALLVRNSFGPEWGEQGYCWMPYEYVLEGIALDWWNMMDQEWLDNIFGIDL